MPTYRTKLGGGLASGPNLAGLPMGKPRMKVNAGRHGVSGETPGQEMRRIQEKVAAHNAAMKRAKKKHGR